MLAFAIPLVLAFTPLAADKASHTVTFTAKATDVTTGTTVEFAFVGPDSDRAYEAMFVTDAKVADIAKAFDEAGIPCGRAIDPLACRFWPVGKRIKIEPSVRDYIDDTEKGSVTAFRYTGGKRDGKGIPVANTNMPSAVFALYSLDQSLILADDARDQSAAYGRFRATGKAREGERISFKVSWDGRSGTEPRRLELVPGKVREAIESLKGSATDLDVLPVFSPELTVAEAASAAKAISVIDSKSVKINGFQEGQIFYRGFLPDEKWRDRQKRLTQPLEVCVGTTNVVYTVIDEDWNVDGPDPKLTPHGESLERVRKTFNGDSCLFFAHKEEKLSRIYALIKELPKTIRNWYVFVD